MLTFILALFKFPVKLYGHNIFAGIVEENSLPTYTFVNLSMQDLWCLS